MSFFKLYFSFKGRISRQTFWFKCVLPILLIEYVIYNYFGTFIIEGFDSISDWVLFIFTIFLVWPLLVAHVKRLHDIDRSAMYIFRYFFVPGTDIRGLVGGWFSKGTEGSNRFGPDPLCGR